MSTVSNSNEETLPKGLNDRATSVDTLNFLPYITALQRFLVHANPPLTVSIEGVWGAGKSSFMCQLEERLAEQGYVTVQFNPWRHDAREALWATFMLAFIDQVSDRLSTRRRLEARLKLVALRSRARWRRTLLWAGLTVALSVVIGLAIASVGAALPQVALGAYAPTLGPLLGSTVVAGIAFVLWVRRNVVERMKDEIQSHYTDATYEERVSFVERFHEEFDQFLNVYVGEGEPVFVFIDDLDRCAVPNVADLVESLHLMLSDDSRLVFLVGMDREKVAGALAAKHGDLLTYLNTRERNEFGLDYGNEYIEKFIQIPFDVPRITTESVNEFVSGIVEVTDPSTADDEQKETKTAVETQTWNGRVQAIRSRVRALFRPQRVDADGSLSATVPGWSPDRLRRVTALTAPFLDHNPRQLKRFVNLYSLTALLAEATRPFRQSRRRSKQSAKGWQSSGGVDTTEPTLEQVGKFVVIPLRWPRLHSEIQRNPKLLVDLSLVALWQRYWVQLQTSPAGKRRKVNTDGNRFWRRKVNADGNRFWRRNWLRYPPGRKTRNGETKPDLAVRDQEVRERVSSLTDSVPDEDIPALLELLLAGLYRSAEEVNKLPTDDRTGEFERLRAEFDDTFDGHAGDQFFQLVGPTKIEQTTGADSTYSLANEAVVRALLEASPRTASMGEEQYREILRYRRDVERNPDAAWVRIDFANFLYGIKQMEEAEVQYRTALQLEPDDAIVRYNYANLLYDQGRTEEAEEHYREALRFDPDDADVHTNFGNLLYDLGRISEAERHYEDALDLDPSAVTHSNYANLLNRTGRVRKAESHYLKAVELDPNNALVNNNYGYLLIEQGKVSEAERYCLKALDLDPEAAYVHDTYAKLRHEQGHLEDSESHYRRASELGNDSPEFHRNFAALLAETGREEEAEEHRQRARDLAAT